MICVNVLNLAENKVDYEVRECPAASGSKHFVVCCPLGTLKSGRNGMAADQETIRKSDKDNRQYQAIRLETVWWSYWFLIRRQLNRSRRCGARWVAGRS